MRNASAKAVVLLLGGTIVLAVLTLVWAIGAVSSEAQQSVMYNCPQAGKWAISVWGGADGTETSQALATCGPGAVDFAYSLDPGTNGWLGYFEGHADISQLLTLNGKQGVIARGAAAATSGSLAVPGATYVGTTSQGLAIEFEVSADGLAVRKVKYRVSGTEPGGGTCDTFATSTLGPSTVGTAIVDNSFAIVHTQFDMSGHFETQSQATGELTVHEPQADNVPPCDAGPLTWTATIPSATPTAVPPAAGQMHNCPPAGRWSIAVWDGASGTPAADALATCGAGAVAAAYALDPQTGGWLGYFEGRPEVSKLLTLSEMQGVLALGLAAGPVATLTPPTPEPTAVVVEGPNYEMSSQVTDLINQERLNNGLNALSVNQALVSSSFEYAGFLIVNKLFGHDLDGLRAHERAEKYGYVGLAVGEILAGGNSAEMVLQAWIQSPDHYYLMMMPEFDEIGVGCYKGPWTTLCAATFGAVTS